MVFDSLKPRVTFLINKWAKFIKKKEVLAIEKPSPALVDDPKQKELSFGSIK